jgi:excisionase family DNA binding protein
MAEQTTHTGRLLTFQQVAEKWNCSPRTVTRKVERGEIEVVELSDRLRRIPESIADDYAAGRIRKRAGGGHV